MRPGKVMGSSTESCALKACTGDTWSTSALSTKESGAVTPRIQSTPEH